jgi:hypothetical protein
MFKIYHKRLAYVAMPKLVSSPKTIYRPGFDKISKKPVGRIGLGISTQN